MTEQHILVVEDHEALLNAVRDILESEGYSVSTAGDGMEALDEMAQCQPDLIVADIMMPRMDGYTFYKEVRKRPEWTPIPFIFLTAKAEREDILRGKGLGAEEYITKPFDPEELVVSVNARLGRAHDIRQATRAQFDELKRQIVTILGHELRTPLTYIQGYTELALEDAYGLSPNELETFLMGIQKGADRLNALVEDLLLLVRIDTGRAEEEFEATAFLHPELTSLIAQTSRKHADQAREKGVTLHVELPDSLPPVFLCEPFFVDALGRVIENGIKFADRKDGQVIVRAREAEDTVRIDVIDNGIGVAEEKIAHLFERFQQIDREQMEQQGVGLGLPIAQELIGLHDGEIEVESELGHGSRFTILLPIAEVR